MGQSDLAEKPLAFSAPSQVNFFYNIPLPLCFGLALKLEFNFGSNQEALLLHTTLPSYGGLSIQGGLRWAGPIVLSTHKQESKE